MTMTNNVIRQITFTEDGGLDIEFFQLPDDSRGGILVMKTMSIAGVVTDMQAPIDKLRDIVGQVLDYAVELWVDYDRPAGSVEQLREDLGASSRGVFDHERDSSADARRLRVIEQPGPYDNPRER